MLQPLWLAIESWPINYGELPGSLERILNGICPYLLDGVSYEKKCIVCTNTYSWMLCEGCNDGASKQASLICSKSFGLCEWFG